MARSELPDLIGFVDKPFDPETYVEQEFYATDASGTERLIPPTNIIHWKHVINDDGTSSVSVIQFFQLIIAHKLATQGVVRIRCNFLGFYMKSSCVKWKMSCLIYAVLLL